MALLFHLSGFVVPSCGTDVSLLDYFPLALKKPLQTPTHLTLLFSVTRQVFVERFGVGEWAAPFHDGPATLVLLTSEVGIAARDNSGCSHNCTGAVDRERDTYKLAQTKTGQTTSSSAKVVQFCADL
jgi:hypothetical protein